MLIAIEGIDASGKATQALLLRDRILHEGLTAATLSFPRYQNTLFAGLVADYLNGKFGNLESVPAPLSAILYAGDRYESLSLISEMVHAHDVLILDRYVASNLAHQSAKLRRDDRASFIRWLDRLEHEVFHMPRADITILLDIPVEIASRMQHTKGLRSYTREATDLHERDLGYLQECTVVYRSLAQTNFGSKWILIDCVDTNGQVQEPEQISKLVWGKVESILVCGSAR